MLLLRAGVSLSARHSANGLSADFDVPRNKSGEGRGCNHLFGMPVNVGELTRSRRIVREKMLP